eukprot:TRINITY_DN5133_c0_g1_i1.p1 TRINITY_DN5133_c0_g1~~TRINITY_DN5133_c0_g1_i1.p1  ORF type:complete len:496 (-),score=86.67 TRINITY_DN5133_c0_g1_i1:55-1473(-)
MATRHLYIVSFALSTCWKEVDAGLRYQDPVEVDFASEEYAPAVDGQKTVIDPTKTWGKWDGWGVSLCWWANIFGHRYDLARAVFSDDLMVTVNGEQVPGLNLNIVRYNAGATSWNTYMGAKIRESAAFAKMPFRQIAGYWKDWASEDPSSKSWDWTVDAKQREMLRMAKYLGATHFELFSNSPMWWMTYDHNPSGAELGTDNLSPWNYGNHSIYLATVAEKFKELGVEFTSVEPFNEPIAIWWTAFNNQEGCHFDHGSQAMVIHNLHAELQRRGLKIGISASDENMYDQALATWNSFDNKTRSKVGTINVHGYQGIAGNRQGLYEAAAGKRLWNTEYGDDDASGMTMATVIMMDFHNLHNTAWCYWQVLDNAAGWGLMEFEEHGIDYKVGKVNMKFFVLAHFSRHIREGMTILTSSPHTVAAYDAARRRLVLVTVNYDVIRSTSSRGTMTCQAPRCRSTSRGEASRQLRSLM